jgi:hypothetical protein
MVVVGGGVWKPVPGTTLVAFAGTSPAGVEPAWQFSQVCPDGTCEVAPDVVDGNTTMLLMP